MVNLSSFTKGWSQWGLVSWMVGDNPSIMGRVQALCGLKRKGDKGWEEDCESFLLYSSLSFLWDYSLVKKVCVTIEKRWEYGEVVVFILVMKNGWGIFKYLVGVSFHLEYDKMLGLVVHITIVDFCCIHLVVFFFFHKNKIFIFYSAFRIGDIVLPYDDNY